MPKENNVSELEKPILQVFDAYQAAVFAKDVDAFIALYAPEVYVFDLWGQWTHEGLGAWREMAAHWLGSLGTDRVVVEFDHVQTTVTPEVAIAHAFVTYKAVSAEGRALRGMNNRMTWVLQPKNGTWKIVHAHTSSPIDPATAKVMLKR